MRDAPPIVVVAKSAQLRFRLRRKLRLRVPLLPPPPPPRGARRGPRIETSKRKCAAPGGREKGASAGRSAQAQTSCRRRGMVGSPLRRSGTETPGPWGTLWPGEIWDTLCSSFRCRWPVVDEGFSIDQRNNFYANAGQRVATAQPLAALPLTDAACPLRASGTRGKRSWSNASLHPDLRCTAPRETTDQACTVPRRARRPVLANTQTPSHADPRTATLHVCAKLRPKAVFSFGPCTARFLFHKREKKMGGASPLDKPPLREQNTPPAAATAALPASDPNLSLRISE